MGLLLLLKNYLLKILAFRQDGYTIFSWTIHSSLILAGDSSIIAAFFTVRFSWTCQQPTCCKTSWINPTWRMEHELFWSLELTPSFITVLPNWGDNFRLVQHNHFQVLTRRCHGGLKNCFSFIIYYTPNNTTVSRNTSFIQRLAEWVFFFAPLLLVLE